MRKSIAPLVLTSLALGTAAHADVVTLTPSKDNTLYENASGALSNGLGPEFYVARANSGFLRRGLVAFDLVGSVPAGSVVNSATLTMLCTGVSVTDSGNTRIIGLHAATMDWGEGTSNAFVPGGGGAPSTANDATWIHTFYSSSTWTAAGGDYVASPSASTGITGTGSYMWSSAQLTADVQAWADDPAASFGWVVVGDESANGTGRGFSSREGSFAPSLMIDFTPPPPVTSYCTGKTNSLACVPFMTATGVASASSTAAFTLSMNDSIPNESGFLIYSFKKANLNFHGAKLCVKAPFKRTGAKAPKNPGGGCTGWVLRRNFNGTIQSGIDPQLTAGQVVRSQWFNRDPADPAGFGDGLSDALEFTIAP